MKIFKKEKKVVKLILRHIDKTQECVTAAASVIGSCTSGCSTANCSQASDVSALEHEADILLRETRELMYSGAYLPLIRADIYRLMSRIDDVANKAENTCDVCCLQRPLIPESYRNELNQIMQNTVECFAAFRLAAIDYFDRKGKAEQLREHLAAVNELESNIDTISRALVRKLFTSDLSLPEKLHLESLIDAMVLISDTIEDAADELDLLNVKGLV